MNTPASTPTTILRRLALTGLVAIDSFNEDANPNLRGEYARRAIFEWDGAMGRIDDVMRIAALDSMDSSGGEYLHERDTLTTRVRAATLAVGRFGESLEYVPFLNTDKVVAYMRAASADIHTRLDRVEDALHLTGDARMAGLGSDAEGLEDAVTHILESAHRTRKQFSKVYKIPREFRPLLRHDAALKAMQAIRPPFDRTEKSRMKRTFDDEAFDVFVPKGVKGKDVQRAYDSAMRSFTHSLEQGLLRGGTGASFSLGKIEVTGNRKPKVFVLASKAKKLCKWSVNLVIANDTASVMVRVALTDKGIAKVLKAWVKGAMETMQSKAGDTTSQREYIVEQMDDTLDHNNGRFSRSWAKGPVHTQVTLSEDGESMLLKLEALRVTEMDLGSDEDEKSKRLLQLHALNRAMIGHKGDTERKVKQSVKTFGGSLIETQMVRQRSNSLHTTGYRFFISIPLESRSHSVLRAVADMIWAIGKGVKGADPEEVEEMAAFEKEFGVSTTRGQSARVANKQRQKKLAARIRRMLDGSELRLSRKQRKELERTEFALKNKLFTNTNQLVLEIPAFLDEIEERFQRSAGVRTHRPVIDTDKLRGHLSRHLPGIHKGATLRRVAAQGIDKGVLPRREDLIALIVAQADQDREIYGRNSDRFVLHLTSSLVVEDARLADITCPDGTVLKVSTVGKRLRVEAVLTPHVRQQVAA